MESVWREGGSESESCVQHLKALVRELGAMNISLLRERSMAIFLIKCAMDISMLSFTRYASG